MGYFSIAATAAQAGKFGAVINSRISKSCVQTIFEAADKITPRFKAVVSPTEQIMRALSPVNILATGA